MNKDSLENVENILFSSLPFSQSCENNRQAILEVLQQELKDFHHVLEIGSGTGQHSVYFAPRLPHLQWQTSDLSANHHAIQAWHNAYPAPNLHAPLVLDLRHNVLSNNSISNKPYDAVFTANTLHIIGWALASQLFQLAGDTLSSNAKLIVYGPFNENGDYTSEGNRQFDVMLRQGNTDSGICNKEDVIELAKNHSLILTATYPMPANNQLLVFQKN